jgi:hypothetical protein
LVSSDILNSYCRVVTAFTDSVYAYYSEYNWCDGTSAGGSAEISSAGFSSSIKTGASAAITIDVGTTECVETGDFEWDCTYIYLFPVELSAVWTPNGTPSPGKQSSSSRDMYGSYRYTYSGVSVPADVQLSIVRDGVDLTLASWSNYAQLYNAKDGSMIKTKYY